MGSKRLLVSIYKSSLKPGLMSILMFKYLWVNYHEIQDKIMVSFSVPSL